MSSSSSSRRDLFLLSGLLLLLSLCYSAFVAGALALSHQLLTTFQFLFLGLLALSLNTAVALWFVARALFSPPVSPQPARSGDRHLPAPLLRPPRVFFSRRGGSAVVSFNPGYGRLPSSSPPLDFPPPPVPSSPSLSQEEEHP
ncbi:protein ORF20A [Pigeon adenovirus 1]